MVDSLRLGKIFSILLGIITISLYSYGSVHSLTVESILLNLIISLASLFFLLSAGYLMNDYCDIQYDLINKPEKVYLTRFVSRKLARYISGIFFVVGLLIAAAVNRYFFIWYIFDTLGLIFYNLQGKKFYYLKSVLVSLLVVSIYPLSLALTSNGFDSPRRDSLLIFPFWLFLTIFAFELMQDIKDFAGDQMYQAKTLPVKIGIFKTRNLATISALAAIPVAFLPYYFGQCGGIYLWGYLLVTPILIGTMFLNNKIFSCGLFFSILGITVASLFDIMVIK
ncbi:MAG: UbiA family prenyltransferase [Elusimicrobiota bacterium]